MAAGIHARGPQGTGPDGGLGIVCGVWDGRHTSPVTGAVCNYLKSMRVGGELLFDKLSSNCGSPLSVSLPRRGRDCG